MTFAVQLNWMSTERKRSIESDKCYSSGCEQLHKEQHWCFGGITKKPLCWRSVSMIGLLSLTSVQSKSYDGWNSKWILKCDANTIKRTHGRHGPGIVHRDNILARQSEYVQHNAEKESSRGIRRHKDYSFRKNSDSSDAPSTLETKVRPALFARILKLPRGGSAEASTDSIGGGVPSLSPYPPSAHRTDNLSRNLSKRRSSGRAGGRHGHSTSSASTSYFDRNDTSSDHKKSSIKAAWEWVQAGNLPRLQVRVEPNTTLKLRKRFRPLKTVVTLGADFNTQLGVWQFKSSWEDSIIGGRLTLAGRELQLSKTWLLSVGAVEDLVTRLRFRAAVDLGTGKAYARCGFRTERLSPINVVEGFTLIKQLPLDGSRGNVKLEVKANFAFPEPEIEYSTENNRSIIGMGDIEMNIDELNLLLDY